MSVSELLSAYGSEYLSALLMTWQLTALSFVIAMAIGLAVLPVYLMTAVIYILINYLLNRASAAAAGRRKS